MTRNPRPALALGLAALSVAAVALAPAEAAVFGRKKPAPAAAPAKPVAASAPAAPPTVSGPLSGAVLQAAAAYRAYVKRTAVMTGAFADGKAVETMLESAETSDPVALSRGVVAYAAVTALQEPSFVEGVRAFGVDPAQRRLVADRLIANPAYAAQFPGAGAAAARIAAALRADGASVTTAGASVKQSAYDLQKKPWSKTDVPDRPGRLARAKTLAAKPMSSTPEEMAELSAAIQPGGQSRLIDAAAPIAPLGGAYTSTVVRGLAVAALAALGVAGDDNDAAVQGLLNDTSGAFCHNMAKLNLYQCLSVAKPFYEDMFCLGQHVLLDTGQCVTKGAGAGGGGSAALTAAAGVAVRRPEGAVSP